MNFEPIADEIEQRMTKSVRGLILLRWLHQQFQFHQLPGLCGTGYLLCSRKASTRPSHIAIKPVSWKKERSLQDTIENMKRAAEPTVPAATVGAPKNFYRRVLPDTCIAFGSDEGKQIFKEALLQGRIIITAIIIYTNKTETCLSVYLSVSSVPLYRRKNYKVFRRVNWYIGVI